MFLSQKKNTQDFLFFFTSKFENREGLTNFAILDCCKFSYKYEPWCNSIYSTLISEFSPN